MPIFGTKRRTYLEENLAALSVELTETDLRRINKVAPHGVASGARYPEAMMHLVTQEGARAGCERSPSAPELGVKVA